jgi:hypothetical protein
MSNATGQQPVATAPATAPATVTTSGAAAATADQNANSCVAIFQALAVDNFWTFNDDSITEANIEPTILNLAQFSNTINTVEDRIRQSNPTFTSPESNADMIRYIREPQSSFTLLSPSRKVLVLKTVFNLLRNHAYTLVILVCRSIAGPTQGVNEFLNIVINKLKAVNGIKEGFIQGLRIPGQTGGARRSDALFNKFLYKAYKRQYFLDKQNQI